MMAVSFSLIVPTVMSITAPSDTPESHTDSDIQILSHAIAITLLIIFVIYLNFRKWFLNAQTNYDVTFDNNHGAARAFPTLSHGLFAISCILLCTTLCASLCAYYLVGSIDGLAKASNINKTFISLVLIPPTGYFAKCVNIMDMARRCQIDFVLKSIIYSILQIVLFVIPLLIILGWIIEKPFTLDFDVFEGTIFFLALVVMTSTIQDGKANYFDGIMLIGT
jgi:Ca2+:H+ antiporter